MKLKIINTKNWFAAPALLAFCLFQLNGTLLAQDSTVVAAETTTPAKAKPVKNTFQSVWLVDNQTVMVPVKGTWKWTSCTVLVPGIKAMKIFGDFSLLQISG
ncbi:MAG: hypothetical protein IPP43_09745 [Chitinophagaceae bacterium]|nr:hypothetical protein [Chitinophagaceae bacterium]